jgi:aminocarboxymuconate-semialdehyde decarboxylase
MNYNKIDSHAHILPKNWPKLKDKYGYGGWIYLDHFEKGKAHMMRDDGKFFRTIDENCWNPEAILPDMDKHRVQQMVLCTVPILFSYWAKPEHTFDFARILNDHIAEVQNGYDHRFIALATLPMQNIDLSIQELERLNSLGIKGIQIGSHIEDRNLDDVYYFPLWERCEALDIAVFVHPWDMMGETKMPKYFLPWLVGMPAETTLAVCSMIFGGVFDKFPKLRVMFAHAGGSLPFTIGRISHGWHARPDLCNVNQIKDPLTYLDKFWVDGITHDTQAFHYLLKIMGEDKICYGTDYPFPLGDLQHGQFIESMPELSTETKNKIFVKNVKDWLNL